MQWINSNGGPLLLLPQELLAGWSGINPPTKNRKIETSFRWNTTGQATDYDRACDVQGYIGLLEVATGQGLVLGDEPLATTWYTLATPSEGLLVRWKYVDNEQAIIEHLAALPGDLS